MFKNSCFACIIWLCTDSNSNSPHTHTHTLWLAPCTLSHALNNEWVCLIKAVGANEFSAFQSCCVVVTTDHVAERKQNQSDIADAGGVGTDSCNSDTDNKQSQALCYYKLLSDPVTTCMTSHQIKPVTGHVCWDAGVCLIAAEWAVYGLVLLWAFHTCNYKSL